MQDRREDIIDGLIKSEKYFTADNFTVEFIKDAMDQYFTERAMELLEYMAENDVECNETARGVKRFHYKGEWITKEQLFENFL